MRVRLPVVAVGSVLAAGLVLPTAVSAVDDPRIGKPPIGPCHVQVDKIKTQPRNQGPGPESTSLPTPPPAATKAQDPDPDLGQGEVFRRTNNQAITTGVFVKCR
jgi:hypothetical protein